MKADMIFYNGTVYTMDAVDSKAEAIAFRDDRIIAIGKSDEVITLKGEGTKAFDLDGKVVLPGLIESHVHLPGNAYNVMYNINLFDAKDMEETMQMITSFIEKHPERDIYYGRGFMTAVFPGEEGGIGPRKERLDAICSDKPVIIVDYGGHVAWLNTAALDKFNITKDTPEIEGGIIEKDPETGELWGILKEEARLLYGEQQFTTEERKEALKLCQDILSSYGYTTILAQRQSGSTDPVPIFDAMKALEDEGGLNMRIHAAREIKPCFDEFEQLDDLKRYRDEFVLRKGNVYATTAKFFADGTVEGGSAALLDPYEAAAGYPREYRGELLWGAERMADIFTKTLEAGFNIHVHAIGDAAIKETVDALEIAQRNVPGDHRNCITHLQVMRDEDIKRMADLGIVACVNAYWHFKDPCVFFESEKPYLGEARAEREFPLRSFLEAGTVITCSADYPVTTEPNAFHAIRAAVTRNVYHEDFYKVEKLQDPDDPKYLLNPDERVTVKDMVKAYTVNAAYALHLEDEIGSLEIGKKADAIVIDRDVFNTPPLEISDIKVIRTVFDGKIVYERE